MSLHSYQPATMVHCQTQTFAVIATAAPSLWPAWLLLLKWLMWARPGIQVVSHHSA